MDDDSSLIERWFAAGDAGDVGAFDEFLHADVVIHAPLGLSSRGVDAEREVWVRVREGFPDIRHDIREQIVVGSTVVARAVVTGTHRGHFFGVNGSGKTFTIDQAVWAHVRDGKATEVWEIADTAALLEQLGLAGSA